MQQRIQKIIASCGLASRRKAEEWLRQGRVQCNGVTAQLGDLADDAVDVIYVDGVPLQKEPERLYIMLHKPRGYLTTMADDRGRKTVQELVKDCPERVYPVGRLDQYSEGLLLMTNDGDFAHQMMHPSSEISKTYLVWVTGYNDMAFTRLQQPIMLNGRKIARPEVQCIWNREDAAQLRITIYEGRNRQIRRMCEAAGMHANRLKRIEEGKLKLGKLGLGQWRYLTPDEVKLLKKI